MERLILLLLAPAILVPIVVLCGFAGCDVVFGLTGRDRPIPPTVTATPKSVDHITVSWENTEPDSVLRYRFVRIKGNETQRDSDVDASITTVEDTGLEAGTAYTYQVTTITENGSSDPGTDTASTFKTAFEVDPATIPTDQTVAPGNYCFVQRIPAGQLLADGSKVGITVRGSPAGNVTINNIYISRAAGSGNLWDSFTDLTSVLPSALTLPDYQPQNLDAIDYSLDQVQDLIIAFDFTATAGQANLQYASVPGVTLYFKPGVQQADVPKPGVPTRDSDYITQPDPRLYLVVKIGVL